MANAAGADPGEVLTSPGSGIGRSPDVQSQAAEGMSTTETLTAEVGQGKDRDHGGSEALRQKVNARKDKAKAFMRMGRFAKARADKDDWCHGILHVTVHEAEGLPGDPTLISLCPLVVNRCLIGCATLANSKPLPHPYCVVSVGKLRMAYTSIWKPASDKPQWEEKFRIQVAGRVQDLVFAVKEGDAYGSPHLGSGKIAGAEVMSGKPIVRRWLKLYHTTRPAHFGKARICVSCDFSPEVSGENVGSYTWENRHAYFQARRGNLVTLYADAVSDPERLPPIKLAAGLAFKSESLWDDMFAHICAAKHFIYISGWSVWTQLLMKREAGAPAVEDEQHPALGPLLLRKAEEGVRVCILQWDDRTSVSGPLGFIATTGVMGTFDEDTRKFFEGSPVFVKLAFRGSDQQKNVIKSNIGATNYTHHQKCVLLDTASEGVGAQRRVTAYIGGVDLTIGRYDDAEHSLFGTQATTHSAEYYQNCIAGCVQSCGGPRQPWHDVHSRLEGPVAFDVLTNFEQRWRKQAVEYKDGLLDLHSVGQLIMPAGMEQPEDGGVRVVDPGSPQDWSVQLFRSIDSESCTGFPEGNTAAYDRGLVSFQNGRVMDRSVQNAYIHAIRRAKRFIYIENQYFLGGSGEWLDQDLKNTCNQLIPIEIALKIAEKIRAGKRFAAYITIPLFPEGVPESGTVQEVLHWQGLTMRTMYRIVGQACTDAGKGAHPQDYLNFFAPCKREVLDPNEEQPQRPPKSNSPQALAQATRRCQIYVHAKTMMVDDEYVILGSANINQRSMGGDRDTELAMGAFQPALANRGHVHGFRMSLWREQLGQLEALFESPEALDCVHRVRQLSQANWEAYTGEEVCELPHGHLVAYPVSISPGGQLHTAPGHSCFPDTQAPVLGKKLFASKFMRLGHLLTT